MQQITWNEFQNVELRVGKIIEVTDFKEAIKPAYKITADFGPLGIKKSSAQVVALYTKDELVGKLIIGVLNLGTKRIGPFESEFLVSGFYREDGSVVLAVPDKEAPLGSKLG